MRVMYACVYGVYVCRVYIKCNVCMYAWIYVCTYVMRCVATSCHVMPYDRIMCVM